MAGEKPKIDSVNFVKDKQNVLKTRISPETLKQKTNVTTQDDASDSPGSDSEEDMFMRQISITDCDSPKRISVRTTQIDFDQNVEI